MATLYAQSTGNWSAINWNTAANGSGSNQTPTSADTLVSNSYTVTVDGSYTVVRVTNTSGGTFSLANGVTLTCTDATSGVLGAVAGAAVTFGLNSPNSATVTGIVMGGSGTSNRGMDITGTGTITINGAAKGGSFNGVDSTGADGVKITSAATIYINNGISNAVVGGSSSFARGVNCSASSGAVIYITGNITATQNNAYGLHNIGNNTITVTGNIVAVSNGLAYPFLNSSAANITINGNLTNSTENAPYAIVNSGASTITINGNFASARLSNSSASVINVNGVVSSGINGTGLENTGAATITITAPSGQNALECSSTPNALSNTSASAVINIIGPMRPGAQPALSNTQSAAIIKCTGPFLVSAAGVQAVYSPSLRMYDTRASYFQMRSADLSTIQTFYTAGHPDAQSGQPAANNVRTGTVYGPASELTGTMAVPAAASVAYGVPVDNTTGTATLSPNDVWNIATSSLTTAGSIGERLKNAATVATTGAQIAALP